MSRPRRACAGTRVIPEFAEVVEREREREGVMEEIKATKTDISMGRDHAPIQKS